MPYTLEELERRAYIENRPSEAWWISQAMHRATEEIFELEQTIERLQIETGVLENEIAELKSGLS